MLANELLQQNSSSSDDAKLQGWLPLWKLRGLEVVFSEQEAHLHWTCLDISKDVASHRVAQKHLQQSYRVVVMLGAEAPSKN